MRCIGKGEGTVHTREGRWVVRRADLQETESTVAWLKLAIPWAREEQRDTGPLKTWRSGTPALVVELKGNREAGKAPEEGDGIMRMCKRSTGWSVYAWVLQRRTARGWESSQEGIHCTKPTSAYTKPWAR